MNDHSLKIAHSSRLNGVVNSSFDFIPGNKDKQWTSLVLYRPIDKKLRKLFADFGNQTAFSQNLLIHRKNNLFFQ